MQPIIRPAQPADIATLYVISSKAHLADYYRQLIPSQHWGHFSRHYHLSADAETRFVSTFLQYLSDSDWHVAVAVQRRQIIGYTVAEHIPGGLELHGLFVDPDFQSQGAGSLLFRMSLQWRHDTELVRLTVIAKNERAKRLYMKNGFQIIGPANQLFYGAPQEVMERIWVDI